MDTLPQNAPGRGPVSAACGLFAASLVTIVGIVRGVGPETILMRAAVAGVACGVVVRIVRSVLRHLRESPET